MQAGDYGIPIVLSLKALMICASPFLQQIVGMFKGMNNDQSTIPGRVMNLTGQTSNALGRVHNWGTSIDKIVAP